MGFGLAATAAVFVLFRAGASAWGQFRLRDYRDSSEADWNAERARLRERSQPAGEAAAEAGCGASYATMARIPRDADLGPAWRAIDAGPGVPLSPEVLALVERYRPELDALRQAARCSHHEPAEGSAWVDHGDLLPVWKANRLLLVEGHGLAAKGDARGALDRYLTLAKIGADMAAGSSLAARIGAQAAAHGYLGVADVVAGVPRLPAAELAELDQALAERERHLPSLPDVIRKERLALREVAMRLSDGRALPEEIPPATQSFGARALTLVLPTEAMFGQALPLLDARLRTAERIARDAQRDPSQTARLREVAADSLAVEATWDSTLLNPESLSHFAGQDCALRASYLVARTAIQVERAYSDGRYPEALPDLAQDPCGTGPLVYRRSPDGHGYTLSSVGENGTNGGPRVARERRVGGGDDILVARRGRP
ncbi:hypothetical protein WME75_18045 [Sorangium sp. So ce1014]|uniref:hypothetical protein n=1 Tax=Sorangium sp. So ce1014 TaxID=3133326 RepID=UPI003F631A94